MCTCLALRDIDREAFERVRPFDGETWMLPLAVSGVGEQHHRFPYGRNGKSYEPRGGPRIAGDRSVAPLHVQEAQRGAYGRVG